MSSARIDGRQFTTSSKQRELFALCLKVIKGGMRLQDVPQKKYYGVKNIVERYYQGKISMEHILEKSTSAIVRGDNGNQTIITNGYKIEKNPNYEDEGGETIFYMYLPKRAVQEIPRIFNYGIRSMNYGSMTETNEFSRFQDNVVVVISTNIKTRKEVDEFKRKAIYYGLDVVRPQDIREIQYKLENV